MKIKGLTIIAFLCFGLIIWINFIDFKFTELIDGKGAKAENLIESFCLSFIAAYIFYYFNIYITEKNEKNTFAPSCHYNYRDFAHWSLSRKAECQDKSMNKILFFDWRRIPLLQIC